MYEADDDRLEGETLVNCWVINKQGHESGDGVKDQYHHQCQFRFSYMPSRTSQFDEDVAT